MLTPPLFRPFLRQQPLNLLKSSFRPSSRTITTSSTRLATAPTQSARHPTLNPTARPDLLYRDPERPLPTLSSLSSRRRWLRTLPIFFGIIFISAAGIFNYQKVNSPIIAATLYSLRTNPTVREELGDEVYFASKWAWVWGSINLVKGRVDVTFGVKGTRKKGTCTFKAKRVGGLSGLVSWNEIACCWEMEC